MTVESSAANPRATPAVVFFVLAMCFAGATLAIGWWGVPIVALGWGVVSQRYLGYRVRVAAFAAASAVCAWAGLLLWTATRGPLLLLSTTLGAVVGIPGPVLIAITLAFAALLAWSAATCVFDVRAERQRGGPETAPTPPARV
jgi:hypothetical protein